MMFKNLLMFFGAFLSVGVNSLECSGYDLGGYTANIIEKRLVGEEVVLYSYASSQSEMDLYIPEDMSGGYYENYSSVIGYHSDGFVAKKVTYDLRKIFSNFIEEDFFEKLSREILNTTESDFLCVYPEADGEYKYLWTAVIWCQRIKGDLGMYLGSDFLLLWNDGLVILIRKIGYDFDVTYYHGYPEADRLARSIVSRFNN